MLAIEYSKMKNETIRKQHQNLTQKILNNKMQQNPDKNKIDHCQKKLNNKENYKTQGSITRGKERFIVIEEQPSKLFYQEEKQKHAKKQIKQFPADTDVLRTSEKGHDVLRPNQASSRRLVEDVRIYNILKTSCLRRLEDVRFIMS